MESLKKSNTINLKKLSLENNYILYLLEWTKNFKHWIEEFKKFDSLVELEDFYEKQKKTFWSKEKSSASKLYFFNFILAFLRFYPNYSKRHIEIIWILLKHLKKIDNWLYASLLNNLPEGFKKQVLKEESKGDDYKKFFENISSLNELLNVYEKHRTAFHHRWKNIDLIKSYYLPFIQRFVSFYYPNLDKKNKDKIFKALLVIELNVRKIDNNFKLEDCFSELKNRISEENYNDYYNDFVRISISIRWNNKRWKEYMSSLSLKQLNDFYKKTLTTFCRREKARDIWFFKWFIRSYSKFYKNNVRISRQLETLIKYFKNIDNNWNKFLAWLDLSYKEIEQKAYEIFILERKKPKKINLEWKTVSKNDDKKNNLKNIENATTKKKNLKKVSPKKTKNTITNKKIPKTVKPISPKKDKLQQKTVEKIKQGEKTKLDLEKEKKKIYSFLSIKWVAPDGKTWYQKWIEKLDNYLKKWKFSEKEWVRLIKLVDINSIFSILEKQYPSVSLQIKKEIISKFLDLRVIFSFSEKYTSLLQKIIEDVFDKLKDSEKKLVKGILNNIKKHREDLESSLKEME